MGAAIAAGSHAVKGNWALLVILATRSIISTIVGKLLFIIVFHSPENERVDTDIIIIISPTRLVKIVKVPALFLVEFW